MTENYHGIPLPKKEANSFQFEELIGKLIPLKKKISFGSYGYALSTGKISGHIGKLCLNKQGIREIPLNIKDLEDLTTLELDDNQLRKLPQEIGQLTRLKKYV